MAITWMDLELAFHCADMDRSACAWVHAESGRIHIESDFADGEGPPPEDESGWISLPSSGDLNQRLVDRFVESHCPQLAERVYRCFSRRGAWRAFKNLLAGQGMLESWYRFEARAERRALVEWAAHHGVVIADPPPLD